MANRNAIIIFGCGGHSRSVTDVILLNDPETSLLYIDDNAVENETLYGFPVVKDYPVGDSPCFIAIGDNGKRMAKASELSQLSLVSVISIKANVGIKAKIDSGCFVANFCHIGPEATIGKGTILNTASIIEHEVHVGGYCHIGPNATVSGRCIIGNSVFVGVGATIKDYVTICSNVIIGAGATVVRDITEPGVYVGCPVRKIG